MLSKTAANGESYRQSLDIYTRFNRWCKNGTLDSIFLALQDEGIISIETEIVCLDSTSVKVHPDGTGALKKHGGQAIGRSKGGSPQRFIERFFLRLKKRFRRVFTRFDKMDIVFTGVITLAMIFDAIIC